MFAQRVSSEILTFSVPKDLSCFLALQLSCKSISDKKKAQTLEWFTCLLVQAYLFSVMHMFDKNLLFVVTLGLLDGLCVIFKRFFDFISPMRVGLYLESKEK